MQVWSILVFAACQQKKVSYDFISKLIGVPRPGIGQFLFSIYHYCEQNDLPPLTSIVISHVTGRPAEDVFPEDLDLFESQSMTFVYNWQSLHAPNAEDFKAAYNAT
jgi:hypothetical protein